MPISGGRQGGSALGKSAPARKFFGVQWYLRPLRDSTDEWITISYGVFGLLFALACYFRSGEIAVVSMVPMIAGLLIFIFVPPAPPETGLDLPDWDFD
jgi:hypothetical protein